MERKIDKEEEEEDIVETEKMEEKMKEGGEGYIRRSKEGDGGIEEE